MAEENLQYQNFANWVQEHKIDEIECLVSDFAGTARGKILPASKFLKGAKNGDLRLPEEVFSLTVTGEFWQEPTNMDPASIDVKMVPDLEIPRHVPWQSLEPTGQVICDCFYVDDGEPVDISPRQVLARVVKLYEEKGWKPIVAPELEFYLVQKNLDADYPLEAAIGRSGRQEIIGQAYGIDAANDFDPIVEDIYAFCEAQGVDLDTISHETGPAQLEINFMHGDPLTLADQVFLFKRTVRQAALKHDIYATFMAKPHENEAGSSMHVHQSVLDIQTGENVFATQTGEMSDLLRAHIAGLQRYLPAALPFFAPNVNSYRRLVPDSDAPTNTHWGIDNRTTPLRVPRANKNNMRVENRVPGADANPYLALAASLACGYLGMVQELEPSDPVVGSAYRYVHSLPLHLEDALSKLTHSKPLKGVLGERFVEVYDGVKHQEIQQYRKVISSWEREFLLLNV